MRDDGAPQEGVDLDDLGVSIATLGVGRRLVRHDRRPAGQDTVERRPDEVLRLSRPLGLQERDPRRGDLVDVDAHGEEENAGDLESSAGGGTLRPGGGRAGDQDGDREAENETGESAHAPFGKS